MIQRVFSGVQPTGALHLGNYLGAIKNFIPLQDQYDSALYCIVDQHAITVPQDPDELRQSVLTTAATFIAAGIDTDKAIIFQQSHVPAHSQMAWVLNCVARMGWLNRMTQFKEKAGKNKEKASVGLYTYPILMAADILTYGATHIPVGDDQKQHIELARDIVMRFNLEHAKSEFFPLPEPVFQTNALRIMSLRDGSQKMSKSDPSDYSRINLTDSNDDIIKKFKKAKTDADPMPQHPDDFEGRPEVKNLYGLYAALANISIDESLEYFKDKNFSGLKSSLADVTISAIAPIRDEISRIMDDKDYIHKVLADGAGRARKIADPIVKQTYEIMGMA